MDTSSTRALPGLWSTSQPPSLEEEHTVWDHFFTHDANSDLKYLFGTDQKRIQLAWSWLWTTWEVGVSADILRGRDQQNGEGALDAWLNLGPLTLYVRFTRSRRNDERV